jgi:Sulfotransferase family
MARVPTATSNDARDAREFRSLAAVRLRHTVPVREPLVLISQIERSGGTLLSRLFDNHPECHAHPQELKIGYPKKWRWPALDLGRPDTWFEMLYENRVVKYRKRGYWSFRPTTDDDSWPFLFSPPLQRRLFDACVSSREIRTVRDVLDCYFTSYFNAWLDNHNLYTGPKKIVTGFVPRMAMRSHNIEQFFQSYPDGLLVCIVRDPRGWYGSARRQNSRYTDVEYAVSRWASSTTVALDAQERRPDRVTVLLYEPLVRDTAAVMSRLADSIGIAMSHTLLVPTFNGQPIGANSSTAAGGRAVLPERAEAWRTEVDRRELVRIDELAGDLYARAEAAAL